MFTAEDAARRRGALAVLTRHQGWLFFPLLLLEGVQLHVSSVRTPLQRRDLPHRRLELGLLTARLVLPVGLLLVWPLALGALFVTVHAAVFGALLGAAFAPNHKRMPVLPRGARMDFISRQVLSSRNIRGGVLVDLFMGGLNYQVEHHLFSSMARDDLRHAQPLVRAFCLDHGSPTPRRDYERRSVVRHLNQVGLAARDPFSCPFLSLRRS